MKGYGYRNMLLIICGALLVLLGIFMIVMPKASVKKEVEATPEILRQVRKSGIAELVFGLVILVIGFITR